MNFGLKTLLAKEPIKMKLKLLAANSNAGRRLVISVKTKILIAGLFLKVAAGDLNFKKQHEKANVPSLL